ncbi:hypothetical protein BG004_001778 [Podila humilis]|nr:hypothetical protein BG004_001778 [Podila humilis]
MKITYTQLKENQYTQRSLGPKSGYRIETESIQLEPLSLDHIEPLWALYKNEPWLFEYMPHGPLTTFEKFLEVQERFCSSSEYFNWVVYILVDRVQPDDSVLKDRVLCGSICLLDISLAFRRFEIGAIWFHPAVHSTFVMLETTYALLRFSFEQLQAGRVQWKTHHGNVASQKSATKLGFHFDGVHRKHIIHYNGQWRHTYYYSMTDDDWFGRDEVTTDGRPGLDVVEQAALAKLNDESLGRRGRQWSLENKIEERKKDGKPLPENVRSGIALVA